MMFLLLAKICTISFLSLSPLKSDTLPPVQDSARFYAKDTSANGIISYINPDVPPLFQGASTYEESQHNMMKFLIANIHYPRAARMEGITGTVMVSFIVDSTGQLIDIKPVSKVLGGGLEKEAIQVIQKMQPWIPGKVDGTPVNSKFYLPVRFAGSRLIKVNS